MEGELPGEFTVSPNKKVHFSRGNLQYTTAGTHATADGIKPGTWRFAERQYDYVGSASQLEAEGQCNEAAGNVMGSDNAYISSSYSGWIDLFGLGTSGYHDENDQYNVNYYPYSTSKSNVDETYNKYGYGPSFNRTDKNLTGVSANYDWGVYNAISNGGDAVGHWRTLNYNELDTLLSKRPNASSLRGEATVCDVRGLVLLPDAWKLPEGVSFTPGYGEGYVTNTYTAEQWSKMENGGAVFLPAAGYRNGTELYNVGFDGSYWSSTVRGAFGAYDLYFGRGNAVVSSSYYRHFGFSVRLVR